MTDREPHTPPVPDEGSRRDPEEILASLPYLRKVKEIADRIGIKDRTLYHYARSGEIGYYLVGGIIMLDVREVEEWLRRSYHPPARARRDDGDEPPEEDPSGDADEGADEA